MDYRIEKLNQVIRGWINYYRIGSMKQNLTRIDEHLRTRMRIVIWKQWKKSSKRYWGLRKLGAPEWMAKQSVAFDDHYQAVAKTTGLHLISREILAKRGLLSCLDYYLNWTAVCRTARTVVWEGLEISPYSINRGFPVFYFSGLKAALLSPQTEQHQSSGRSAKRTPSASSS